MTLFSYAAPVMSGIFGFLLLDEGLTLAQLAGAIVVLEGMLAARWGVERSRLAGHNAAQHGVEAADTPLQETSLLGPAIVAQDSTSLEQVEPNQE